MLRYYPGSWGGTCKVAGQLAKKSLNPQNNLMLSDDELDKPTTFYCLCPEKRTLNLRQWDGIAYHTLTSFVTTPKEWVKVEFIAHSGYKYNYQGLGNLIRIDSIALDSFVSIPDIFAYPEIVAVRSASTLAGGTIGGIAGYFLKPVDPLVSALIGAGLGAGLGYTGGYLITDGETPIPALGAAPEGPGAPARLGKYLITG